MGSENGNYARTEIEGIVISVFEDTQEARPRYYAWAGEWDDHDTAQHTRVYRSESCAVDEALRMAKRRA